MRDNKGMQTMERDTQTEKSGCLQSVFIHVTVWYFNVNVAEGSNVKNESCFFYLTSRKMMRQHQGKHYRSVLSYMAIFG